MNYNLKKPCSNCPFRSDKLFPLNVERAESIATGNAEFACHKTVDYSDEGDGKTTQKSEHCAGLLIMLEKMEEPHQMMTIAGRLGLYKPDQLDMNAPVYDSIDDYIIRLEEAGV